MKAPRINGVDLGYGLLLIVIVALGTTCSQTNVLISDVKGEFNLFYDSAVAALLFLNASLLSKKLAAVPLRNVALAVRKQSSVLILAGLIQFVFDPCSFILLLGICMFIGSYLANLSTPIVGFILFISMMISAYLFTNPLIPPPAGYRGVSLGVVQSILFNGYFSVFPWLIFYCAGIIYSRLQLSEVKPLTVTLGIILIVASFMVEKQLNLELVNASELSVKLYPNRTFLLPAFLLFGLGASLLFWGIVILSEHTSWTKFISVIGSMRYSILLFTASLEIAIHLVLKPSTVAMMILFNILIWAIVIPIAIIWRKQHNLGPIERWFRSLFHS